MRVTKVPEKDQNGKLIHRYYARLGDFFGPLRDTSGDAIAALDKELENYHPLNHIYIRCVDGTVLHLHQTPSHGWNYNIIPPSGYKGQGVGVQGTFQEAKARAIEHAEKEFGGVI